MREQNLNYISETDEIRKPNCCNKIKEKGSGRNAQNWRNKNRMGNMQNREKTILQRCFKCLGYEHRIEEYQGEDKIDICIKFAKIGHKVRDCTNPPHCTHCKEDRHIADQMKCPCFNKLIR
ncbi:unnamed protein product [Psylliodes chrysocephalus]|uniref:Uncharacterized protein n=1 Tax=Psylliodes chrysocephalus TaxID=3402493 RepID=A0A9P0CLN1_9CUCU|nr:unnamed protein product [Psylliodes chrysocephala]